jgi:hypothetical protein
MTNHTNDGVYFIPMSGEIGSDGPLPETDNSVRDLDPTNCALDERFNEDDEFTAECDVTLIEEGMYSTVPTSPIMLIDS